MKIFLFSLATTQESVTTEKQAQAASLPTSCPVSSKATTQESDTDEQKKLEKLCSFLAERMEKSKHQKTSCWAVSFETTDNPDLPEFPVINEEFEKVSSFLAWYPFAEKIFLLQI